MAQHTAAAIRTDALLALISTVDPLKSMSITVVNNTQLGLGLNPFQPTHLIDLAEEKVRVIGAPTSDDSLRPAVQTEPPPRLSRQTGRYLLDVRGETIVCVSLKDMLGKGLRKIEELKPGTLLKLEAVKGRTKRIVARDPKKLFEQDILTEKYSEKLMEGWWYGTNNSAGETTKFLRHGCDLAGLVWGKDISTSL